MDVKTERKPYPFKGKKVAKLTQHERDTFVTKQWCHGRIFEFEEGFETLHSMFFYRDWWVNCVILPKSMKYLEQYSFVPYVETERKTYYHTPDDYEFPCDYRHRPSNWWWEVAKFTRRPISLVIRSPHTVIDPHAFGDGEEEVALFLEFDGDYNTSRIQGKIKTYKYGEWHYVNGTPTPKWSAKD